MLSGDTLPIEQCISSAINECDTLVVSTLVDTLWTCLLRHDLRSDNNTHRAEPRTSRGSLAAAAAAARPKKEGENTGALAGRRHAATTELLLLQLCLQVCFSFRRLSVAPPRLFTGANLSVKLLLLLLLLSRAHCELITGKREGGQAKLRGRER